MKRTASVLLLCVLVATAFALVGCNMIAEKAGEAIVEQTTGTKIDQDGDSITVEGEDGKVTVGGENAEVPADWPDDVPIYPDTTVVTSVQSDVDGAKSMSVTLDSTDDAITINDWYVDEIKGNDWEVTAQVANAGSYVISAEKGDSQLTIAIAGDLGTDNTGINLVVTPAQ